MKQTKRVLSVVLALAMVFAMSIMVSAAGCDQKTVKNGDGTITVSLISKGDDMATFSFGIAYNKAKLEVVNNADDEAVTWGPAGSVKMADGGVAITGSYVTIGGTHSKDTFPTTAGDVIASVTFKVTGEIAEGDLFVASGDIPTDFAPETADKVEGAQPIKPADIVEVVVSEAPASEAPAPSEGTTPEQSAVAPQQSAVAPQQSAVAPAQSQAPTATTKAPKTADTASVVIPVVAIVAAAAAVVVVSKKRVEE